MDSDGWGRRWFQAGYHSLESIGGPIAPNILPLITQLAPLRFENLDEQGFSEDQVDFYVLNSGDIFESAGVKAKRLWGRSEAS